MYTVFTSFDMALAEYNRKSKLHTESIMRVERRTLQSLIKTWNFVIKLINVYGDFCFLCDGKKIFPNDYWERWPEVYKEKAKKHEEKRIEKPIGFVTNKEEKENKVIEDKTYFKDIYNRRPVHYDCTIGKIKLVWNDEVIDIFRDTNGPNSEYRPVVDDEYAEETWGISLSGEYFTKEDLDEYLKKVKEYKEAVEKRQAAMEKELLEIKKVIDTKVDSNIKDKLYCMDYWYYVYSDAYILGYDPDDKTYTINKFYTNQSIDRRFYYWNQDKEFEKLIFNNREDVVDKFIELVSKEYRDILEKEEIEDKNKE